MKKPIVIYSGPSMLDGAPIVVLASTGSKNVKTGSLVQTWIMRADKNPSQASAEKADSSVCGSCPRRHSLGGDCYVQIVHAPRSVWESWDRQDRPGSNWADQDQILRLQSDALAYGLRLGSYGDPAAVPYTVWQDLISALNPRVVVGYTHAWQAYTKIWRVQIGGVTGQAQYAWLRDNLMASADTIAEAEKARALGWRFFLAVGSDVAPPERTIQCPATTSAEKTCDDCGACDGAKRGTSKASVYLVEHGARSRGKAKRLASLAVLA